MFQTKLQAATNRQELLCAALSIVWLHLTLCSPMEPTSANNDKHLHSNHCGIMVARSTNVYVLMKNVGFLCMIFCAYTIHNYSMLEQLDSLGNKTHIIESKRLSLFYWYTRMSSPTPSPSFGVTWRARASLVLCNVTLLFVTWSLSPQHPKTGFCRNLNAQLHMQWSPYSSGVAIFILVRCDVHLLVCWIPVSRVTWSSSEYLMRQHSCSA